MDKYLIKPKNDNIKPKPVVEKIIIDTPKINDSKLIPWVEKYRPNNLDDVVFQNNVVNALKSASTTGKLQHLLFYGSPGTGKTSTILALAKELFTPEHYRTRILELNASDERGISVVREKIKTFSQTKAASIKGVKCPDFKIVILDEADSMTVDAQSALRRVIEDFTDSTRFCIICNYVSKIIDPITSRCAKFRFNPLTLEAQIERLKDITDKEGLSIDVSLLEHIISITDGDLRRSINLLQSVSQLGKGNLNKKRVNEICGIIPIEEVTKLFEVSRSSTAEDIEKNVSEFILEGYDVNQFLVQLTELIVGSDNISNVVKSEIAYKIAQSEKLMIEGSDYQIQLVNLCVEIRKLFKQYKLK